MPAVTTSGQITWEPLAASTIQIGQLGCNASTNGVNAISAISCANPDNAERRPYVGSDQRTVLFIPQFTAMPTAQSFTLQWAQVDFHDGSISAPIQDSKIALNQDQFNAISETRGFISSQDGSDLILLSLDGSVMKYSTSGESQQVVKLQLPPITDSVQMLTVWPDDLVESAL